MSTSKWSLLRPLKRAVKKIKVLLNLSIHSWHLAFVMGASASSRRMLSFSDRPGLGAACEEEEAAIRYVDDDVSGSGRGLYRATSEEDVDNKAEMFICNFYRQLQMERQVSLQLRYCRQDSFDLPDP